VVGTDAALITVVVSELVPVLTTGVVVDLSIAVETLSVVPVDNVFDVVEVSNVAAFTCFADNEVRINVENNVIPKIVHLFFNNMTNTSPLIPKIILVLFDKYTNKR